jgi:hypothetical protein
MAYQTAISATPSLTRESKKPVAKCALTVPELVVDFAGIVVAHEKSMRGNSTYPSGFHYIILMPPAGLPAIDHVRRPLRKLPRCLLSRACAPAPAD